MFTSLSLAWSSFATAVLAADLPQQLFSPLITSKVSATANLLTNPPRYPQWTDAVIGKWSLFPADTWTSGFFPATLYEMNRRKVLSGGLSNGTDWLGYARAWSVGLTTQENVTHVGHDVGFLSFPFVEELAINPQNPDAARSVNAFAGLLAQRFSPVVGCTRSWDTGDPNDFQVIIDNMMNLDVLFTAEQLTGNHTLRDIAISHADTTLKNHLRSDGSSYHLVRYDGRAGAVVRKQTVQGYSDNSTWTRGQAWGLYGFTRMYQRTRLDRYLDTARHMASYFISRIPADGVGFDAPPGPDRPPDSSAATIASTGLLLLAQQELSLTPPNTENAAHWSNVAIKILGDTAKLAWRPDWQSLLSNGTVNNPQGNRLTGIVYGDYYFIKAGNELLAMGLAPKPGSSSPSSASSASRALSAFAFLTDLNGGVVLCTPALSEEMHLSENEI